MRDGWVCRPKEKVIKMIQSRRSLKSRLRFIYSQNQNRRSSLQEESMYEVYSAEITEWCEQHKGEKYHAILSDFPYGLAFMGNDWVSESRLGQSCRRREGQTFLFDSYSETKTHQASQETEILA